MAGLVARETLLVFAFILPPFGASVNYVNYTGCGWYGTTPFCNGECPGNMEMIAKTHSCDLTKHPACDQVKMNNGWFSSCVTGNLALCCPKGWSQGCQWFGRGSPICWANGKCQNGYVSHAMTDECGPEYFYQWPCNIANFGDRCMFGTKKIFCCPAGIVPQGKPADS